MRLLFDCPRGAELARAAVRMGHAARLRNARPWFDAVLGFKPDRVLVSAEAAAAPEFRACLASEGFDHVVVPDFAPAADCAPDWAGGTFREAMKCQVAVVGTRKPGHDPSLRKLVLAGVDLKVFGHGYEGLPQYLGVLNEAETADAYRSANTVFDPDGCPWKRTQVVAAGGVWLGDVAPADAADFPERVFDMTPWSRHGAYAELLRQDVMAHHTFHNRLREILGC